MSGIELALRILGIYILLKARARHYITSDLLTIIGVLLLAKAC